MIKHILASFCLVSVAMIIDMGGALPHTGLKLVAALMALVVASFAVECIKEES